MDREVELFDQFFCTWQRSGICNDWICSGQLIGLQSRSYSLDLSHTIIRYFVFFESWSIMCGCGYTSDQHTDISAADTTEKWEFQTHTETSATDAYGDVEFANSGKKIAKVTVFQTSFWSVLRQPACLFICLSTCVSAFLTAVNILKRRRFY